MGRDYSTVNSFTVECSDSLKSDSDLILEASQFGSLRIDSETLNEMQTPVEGDENDPYFTYGKGRATQLSVACKSDRHHVCHSITCECGCGH